MDYLDDESPWGRHSPEADIVPSFSIADDAASPWGAGVSEDDDNPYSAVASAEREEDSSPTPPRADSPPHMMLETAQAAPEAAFEAPVAAPALKKNAARTTKKKKRAGGVKTESVRSDPLALDDVSLGAKPELPNLANLHLTHPNQPEQPEQPLAASPLYPSEAASVQEQQQEQPQEQQQEQQQQQPADFEISVGDAATVGDLSNAHTEYTILMTTTNLAYDDQNEAAVQRRYRDFRWLYRALERNHPGVVVPPPPEKQALGRFNDDFVQFRRAALEQMLVKTARHPALKTDPDFKAFLTSHDLGAYIDHESENGGNDNGSGSGGNGSGSSSSNHHHLDGEGGGKMGLIGSLTSALMLSRGNEVDPWTVEKRARLSELETMLKEVLRDFVAVGQQRKQLSETLREYANVVRVLSDIEATRRLSSVLRSFAKVQVRLAQIAERQRTESTMNLEATLDEYLRLIDSMKHAISARHEVFSSAEEAASELEKKQQALDKLTRNGGSGIIQQDRQMGLEQDIEELSVRAKELHAKAGNIAHLVESEIARVTNEKIAEFRNSVELFLESTIEAHKETIEVWETFYTRCFASKSEE